MVTPESSDFTRTGTTFIGEKGDSVVFTFEPPVTQEALLDGLKHLFGFAPTHIPEPEVLHKRVSEEQRELTKYWARRADVTTLPKYKTTYQRILNLCGKDMSVVGLTGDNPARVSTVAARYYMFEERIELGKDASGQVLEEWRFSKDKAERYAGKMAGNGYGIEWLPTDEEQAPALQPISPQYQRPEIGVIREFETYGGDTYPCFATPEARREADIKRGL
ncbi:MAG TPA: hypothetical protein VFL85_04595 [Candidatus Saccharimonadales bacterium]|nr:hypothetical protein [Candidatus Saccharimonadales bacterium]